MSRHAWGVLLAAALVLFGSVAGPGCDQPSRVERSDGDGDTDLDADLDVLSDSGTDGDGSDEDADSPDWDPLAGCIEGETDERWLVLGAASGELRSYLTGRDCAEPVQICAGCVASAFSPSGDRVVAFVPTEEPARVFDELLVIDLSEPGFPVLYGDFEGARPTWIDEDHVALLAAPPTWAGACEDDAPPLNPEQVELRMRTLSTGTEVSVADHLQRSWLGCCPVASADGSRLALSENRGGRCDSEVMVASVVDMRTGALSYLPWTAVGTNDLDAPIGLLPDGSGFLVQTVTDTTRFVSSLYATTFDGTAARVAGPLAAVFDFGALPGTVYGIWPDFASIQRIGPACELYHRDDTTGGWLRLHLVDGSEEPIDCSTLGGSIRIMDVRQVHVGAAGADG